jgi:hypothetical protein
MRGQALNNNPTYPTWEELLEYPAPVDYGINTVTGGNFVRIYQNFNQFLYMYVFKDATEAENKSWELWRKWKTQE